MRKLISKKPLYRSKFFQVFYFSFGGFFLLLSFVEMLYPSQELDAHPPVVNVVISLLIICFGCVVFFKDHGVVDEVYDEGSALLLRHKNRECRVDLELVEKMTYEMRNRTPWVCIFLKDETLFGKKVVFSPAWDGRIISFRHKKNDDVLNLIDRIESSPHEGSV